MDYYEILSFSFFFVLCCCAMSLYETFFKLGLLFCCLLEFCIIMVCSEILTFFVFLFWSFVVPCLFISSFGSLVCDVILGYIFNLDL
ncbi:hypothetical protein IC575_002606 [Cucumis melo]